MPVWIDRVIVKNVGPIGKHTFDFRRFNLIYGLNESGKTFLVEFLLNSLFRHAAKWSLREQPGRGRVSVRGLDAEHVNFSPDSAKKLEDFWEEEKTGFPRNMARLLVVKGGELDFSSKAPGGVGRKVLKNTLSRETLLDQILQPIQQTVQNAVVQDSEIVGDRRGKIKDREECAGKLRRLESLLDKVEGNYSRGPIRNLELKLEKVRTSMEEQERAKRHQAYTIHQSLNEWKRKRENLPDHKLEELRDHIRDYQKLQELISEKKQELEIKKAASRHVHWLENALETWEEKSLDQAGQPSLIFALLGFITIIISIILSFLDLTQFALGFTFLGTISLAVYFWRFRKWSTSLAVSQEKKNIQKSYRERFGEALHGIADLKSRLEARRKAKIQANQIQADIQKLEEEQQDVDRDVRYLSEELTEKELESQNWEKMAASLREKARDIDKKIKDCELTLQTLGVEKSDYLSSQPSVTFQEAKLEELIQKAHTLEEDLQAAEKELGTLKQDICRWTGDEIDIPWNRALENLQQKRAQILFEYQQLTAEIVAKIGVTQVLDRVRKEEDEIIRQGLNSIEVTEILESVTGRYQGLDLVGDQILVKSDSGDFPLRDLSTGAQEQIQLALRMGFASHFGGSHALFLILDDAFQHSDWDRRKRLVKKVINLAKQDWQVIYLTMDNHLRDLFLEAGENLFPDQFTYHKLE